MKKCCINCFTNAQIQDHVRSFGETGNCDYCQSAGVSTASVRAVGIYLRDVLSRSFKPWTPSELALAFPSFHYGPQLSQNSVLSILRDDERVFSETLLGKQKSYDAFLTDYLYRGSRFLIALLEASEGYPSPAEDIFAKDKALTELSLKSETAEPGKDKYTLAWESFRHQAKHYARFFEMPGQSRATLLAEITPWLHRLGRDLPIGTTMWRSRIHPGMASDQRDEAARQIGPPPPQSVKNNRMSPAGVSYMYLAEDEEAAVAEIRPNVGDHVWLGRFALKEPIKVVDLSDVRAFPAPSIFDPRFTPDMKRVPDFLRSFAEEISRPVSPDVAVLEYVPSQMVCEYIRSLGYHGVCFRSSLFAFKNLGFAPSKKNYVLFCGPVPDLSHSVALPAFTDWMDLMHWVGKSVIAVKYDTYMPTGAHGGGTYRSFT